jgi:hypothetical protein
MTFWGRRGELKIICVCLVHDGYLDPLEGVALVFEGVKVVKQKVENTVEKDGREDTTLEEADIEKEKTGRPLLGGDLGTKFFLVVENQLLDQHGHVVPIQGKLDEVVHHGAICVGEV